MLCREECVGRGPSMGLGDPSAVGVSKFTDTVRSPCRSSSSQLACDSEDHQLDPPLSSLEMMPIPTPAVPRHVHTWPQGLPKPMITSMPGAGLDPT